MAPVEKLAKKKIFFEKLINLIENYPKILIVSVDYVGSNQMSRIRHGLRGLAVVLMGKNTMIRTALKHNLNKYPQVEKLISYVKENVGFIFCIADPALVQEKIAEFKVPAPARQGVIAPIDVTIFAGPTGIEPSQTSFFQTLGIATRIVKAQIEVISDILIINKGNKVTPSQSALLQKLSICPFTYGLVVKYIYDDGVIYDASILSITNETIQNKFSSSIANVAAFSRMVGMPTLPSVTHSIIAAFKNCAALVIDSEYTFPQLEPIRNYLKDPSAFAAAAAPAVSSAAGKVEKVVEESSDESSDDDMGFSLFD